MPCLSFAFLRSILFRTATAGSRACLRISFCCEPVTVTCPTVHSNASSKRTASSTIALLRSAQGTLDKDESRLPDWLRFFLLCLIEQKNKLAEQDSAGKADVVPVSSG